jgi:outer membrane protein insertion porin family
VTRLAPSLLALALVLGAPAWAAETPTVAGIVVEGNRRVEVEAVKNAISTRPGQPVDVRKLDEDIKSVMKLGFFSDLVVEERGDPEHPTLVFRVVEKPAVRETRIEGNEDLSKDDLKDTIEVKPYSIYDRTLARRTVKKIQDKYVEKGFYLAEVTFRADPQPDNQVDVVFVVNEHVKVLVK